MNVTPAPSLATIERCNQRMTGRVEMLKRVRIRRILAASDMATREAYAKLVPLAIERDAFLAAARARRYLSDLTYMFARFGHFDAFYHRRG